MNLRDKIEELAEEASAFATSDETRQRLTEVTTTAQALLLQTAVKAKALAASEAGQKVIAKGRQVGEDVLGFLAEGDTPTQAAAKAARTHVAPDPEHD
jgi:hypothetical protein